MLHFNQRRRATDDKHCSAEQNQGYKIGASRLKSTQTEILAAEKAQNKKSENAVTKLYLAFKYDTIPSSY